MRKYIPEIVWQILFKLGMFLRGINGFIYLAVGLMLFFVSVSELNHITLNVLSPLLTDITHRTKNIVGLYIFFHGVINIFLVAGLYKNKLWAYLISIGFISSLILMQLYNISFHYSNILLSLIIFDCIFVFVTWHEYMYHKELRDFSENKEC